LCVPLKVCVLNLLIATFARCYWGILICSKCLSEGLKSTYFQKFKKWTDNNMKNVFAVNMPISTLSSISGAAQSSIDAMTRKRPREDDDFDS